MLIFLHAGELSCRISKQRMFATYSNDVGVCIRPLECSIISEALCEALCSSHEEMTLQAMEGSSDSAGERDREF